MLPTWLIDLMKCGIHHLLLLGTVSAAISTFGITIGGIDFQDNAFADSLISSSGSFTHPDGTLAQVLTDNDPGTYAFSHDAGGYVELGFTDNDLVNGPGPDLAIFELDVPNAFKVSLTIGGTTISYPSFATGDLAGFPPGSLNLTLVDLSDFGVSSGAFLDRIVIGLDVGVFVPGRGTIVPTLSLVGAINNARTSNANVPDGGSTFSLCAALTAGLLILSRLVPRN